jgi:hypothetical protein
VEDTVTASLGGAVADRSLGGGYGDRSLGGGYGGGDRSLGGGYGDRSLVEDTATARWVEDDTIHASMAPIIL